MNQNSVRRNLFHGNLSRRPASAGPPNGNVPQHSNGLSNRPSHRLKTTASDSAAPARAFKSLENRDIVVRDKSGSYKLEIPTLPSALIGEDGEELGEHAPEDEGFHSAELTGIDKESMSSISALFVFAEYSMLILGTEFEAALVDMMIRHRNKANDEPDGELHFG
jgi:hypothetical protein